MHAMLSMLYNGYGLWAEVIYFFRPARYFLILASEYQNDFVKPAVTRPLTDCVVAGRRMISLTSICQLFPGT